METIGDAYMAVANLIEDQPDHAKRVAEFALEAVQEASKIPVDIEDPSKGFVEIRVGFHSGSVVSNVVGNLNPRYVYYLGLLQPSSASREDINITHEAYRFVLLHKHK